MILRNVKFDFKVTKGKDYKRYIQGYKAAMAALNVLDKEDDEYLIKFNEILDDFFADLLGNDYDQRLGIDVDDLEDLMQLLADFNAAANPEALERMAALKIKADAMVKSSAFPKRSYSCQVADLARLAPDKYAHLSFGLYDKVVLMDRDRHTNTTVQVAQYTVYPYHAEKNAVQLNSVAGTISSGSKSYSGDVIEYTDPDTSEASNADP